MAKKEKIMVSLTSVILLFLIFFLIIAMIGMYIYYNYMVKVKDDMHDKQDDILNSIQVNTEDTVINKVNTEEEKTISKIDNSKDYVYTVYEAKPSEYMSYQIPKINIDSQYAKEINEEIEKDLINPVKNDDGNFEYGNIEYTTYLSNSFLSVLIEMNPKTYEYSYFKIYSINVETGEKVNNSEILKAKNITEDQFMDKLHSAIRKWYERLVPELETDVDSIPQYKESLSVDDNNSNNKMFLDNEGNINVLTKLYAIAGPMYLYRVLILD